jgi:bifunctional UDP-N-acetylglucosamine pyrophosphorylase/glucosamine-1-phosphate N-acetyltransferase
MSTASVILAAGKGTRMVSEIPKVLHPVLGVPMLDYVLETAERAGCDPRIAVIGYGRDQVQTKFAGRAVEWAIQDEQRGTGHAAAMGVAKFRETLGKAADSNAAKESPSQAGQSSRVLILNGDLPLLRTETVETLFARHEKEGAGVTVLTCLKSDPSGYGRIVREKRAPDGKFESIVEEKDADAEVRALREVNVGVYLFDLEVFERCYERINCDNAQGEYYLTDVVVEAARGGEGVATVTITNELEIAQVNSRKELAAVSQLVRQQILDDLLDHGVTIDDPATTYVEKGVRIGKDARILPFTYIHSGVEIESNCEVGPFARLRVGTTLRDGASVGNFVEIKNSDIGRRTKARHLSYIGDASVGPDVNVGAGTIFANYDGKKKHKTIVEERVFIGSGTILIPPLKLGKRSKTGAGAVVTRGKDVPDDGVVVGVPAKLIRSREKA